MMTAPISETHLMFFDSPSRGPGRPRSTEAMTTVSAWIPASYHDRLIRMASEQDQSVSKTLADILRKALS